MTGPVIRPHPYPNLKTRPRLPIAETRDLKMVSRPPPIIRFPYAAPFDSCLF